MDQMELEFRHHQANIRIIARIFNIWKSGVLYKTFVINTKQ